MIKISSIQPGQYRDIHVLAGGIEGIVQHPPHFYRIMADHFGDSFFVATQDTSGSPEPVGFMMGFISSRIKGHLFIWQIAVAPEAHGRGIGGKLLSHTIGYARSHPHCTALLATVETVNIASQRLFESRNFSIESGRFRGPDQQLILAEGKSAVQNYYGTGTDQIFYLLDLSQTGGNFDKSSQFS